MNTEIKETKETEKIKKADAQISKIKEASNLERLKKQKMILEARIQSAEARLKVSQRKQDTRRKILVGSYYLDKAEKEKTLESLKLLMCGYLTRDSDRKLFGFALNQDKEDSNDSKIV